MEHMTKKRLTKLQKESIQKQRELDKLRVV